MRLWITLAALAACGDATSAPPAPPAAAPAATGSRSDIDVAGLKSALDAGAVVIDVRTPQEFASGHVPGALNHPLGFDPAALTEIPKDGPVYVICASGRRSDAAATQLAAAGFDAVNVKGGTAAWTAAGLPVQP